MAEQPVMTRRAFVLSAASLPLLLPVSSGATPTPLAFTRVTIIDGAGGLQPDRTVVVRGDRIVAQDRADRVQVPPDAQVVSGRGRFLIPGLWDMHVHLSVAQASALPILLANGVTGVRDMGGMLRELDSWRAGIASGALAGPRIIRSGPIVNGKAFNEMQIAVENAAEARGAVRALHKAGVDFIKVHAAISRDAYLGVAGECTQVGLRFAGHLPRAVRPEEASDGGQASLEHLDTLFDGTLAAGVKADAMVEAVTRFRDHGGAELFARFAKNGTAFTPTLAIERASVHMGESRPSPHDKYISRTAAVFTQRMLAKYKDLFTAEYKANQQRQLDAMLPLIQMMHSAGVPLLTGTDMGSSLLVPGYSLHDELSLLSDAGMPTLDVLKAATETPARVLGLKDLGSIQVGKLADMVLLDESPLENIRRTQKIQAVIANGRFFDRAALNALLLAGEKAAQQTAP